MKKIERIYHDGMSWNFSEYFDYLKEVVINMPASLGEFSLDVDRYSLQGNKTLHDARVLSIVVKKNYKGRFSEASTDIELTLIDQCFEGKIILDYFDVSSFSFDEMRLSENPHADIILHEVSVIDCGIYRHQIMLDHDGFFRIEFSGFSHRWVRLDS